ncbi:MAG: YueI family protein [Enterococcus sp.]
MAKDEMQNHLDKGMYGSPLLKPDEQHKYLGTFRERCYVSMTVAEMADSANQQNFLKELALHPDTLILLNGATSESLQREYIQFATETNHQFRIINDFVSDDPDSIGVLIVTDHAVDEKVIDIEEKYPKSSDEPTPIKTEHKKEHFWNKLFH